MDERSEGRRWRVGELAGATGLTVRTLHHYDEIGLLSPSERSRAGHRLYTSGDVRRLYRVLALKGLGVPLGDIPRSLEGGAAELRDALRRQLDQVEQQMERQSQLRRGLLALLRVIESREPTADELIRMMEVMMTVEQYYTPEQLAQLEERRQQLGDEAIKRGEQQWAELIEDAKRHMELGTDPADPAAQDLARRWNELIEAFTGGDEGIRSSLQNMYESEGPQAASPGAVDRELWDYMDRVFAASKS